jgi:predicted site-specific integrase-resolvase
MVTPHQAKSKSIETLASPKAVAKDLNVTEGTLQVWRSTGRYDLPYIKIGGKVMYRVADVNKFIESRQHAHTK